MRNAELWAYAMAALPDDSYYSCPKGRHLDYRQDMRAGLALTR